MAQHPVSWHRFCTANRALAILAAAGWTLFLLALNPSRPGPPHRLHIYTPRGGGSVEDRWLAAQQQVQLERLGAGKDAAGIGSPVGAEHEVTPAQAEPASDQADSAVAAVAGAEAPAAQPLHNDGDSQEQQQMGSESEREAAAAADLQTAAFTAPEQAAGETLEQEAAGGSEPLTGEEQRQQLENADALVKAANMEAIRKAISVSVAAAVKGELPAASVDCAKACRYGEAPGYWRIIPPGRRQWALYSDTCELADLLSLHLQPRAYVEPVAYLGNTATALNSAADSLDLKVHANTGASGPAAGQQQQQQQQDRAAAAAPQHAAVRRRLAAPQTLAAARVSVTARRAHRLLDSQRGQQPEGLEQQRQPALAGWRTAATVRRPRRRLTQRSRHERFAHGAALEAAQHSLVGEHSTTPRGSQLARSGAAGDASVDFAEDLTGLGEDSSTAHSVIGTAQEVDAESEGMAVEEAVDAEAMQLNAQLQAAVQQSQAGSRQAGNPEHGSMDGSAGSGSSDAGSSSGPTAAGSVRGDRQRPGILLLGDSIDRDTLIDVCAAASGGETQPDYFLTHMDEECRVEYGSTSRCLICELPTLVVANQMLWSAHPVNPLKASANFHLGKRKGAEMRIHEAWQLFQQRVGRPPDLMVLAINFWDLAMYTMHGLGLQPHLNEPLLHAWRRDFGDLLEVAQVLAGNTTKVLYHTAPVPGTGPTAREEVQRYKLARAGHVAQLNAAGRAAARAAGIPLVDMALMSAAFHTPAEYLKDQLHPKPLLLLEAFNIYLNVLQASQQDCR